jgi:hypothetical protein
LHKFKFVFAAVVATLCLLPLPSRATLGGDASTTQVDQARLKASMRVAPGEKFAVHEMTLPGGTVVREFVSPQGQVFAVSWKGPFKPDLRQLMGDYFDRYVQATPAARGGHNASRIAQTDLVVQSMGHMRAFSGHAFVPGMLPAGVAESDLQ